MSKLRYSFRAGCVALGVTLSTASLGGCTLAHNQMTFDRGGNKTIQNYRDGLSPERQPETAKKASLPPFQSFVATPADLQLPTPLVTVSVDQTVSLRDLMFELAQQAGVDIEMDPDIHGSIIFTAKDRPFSEVVKRICRMAGLRYTFKDNVLRVELDRPYIEDYRVNYTGLDRKSTSKIKTSISNGTTGGSGTSSDSGSEASIDNSGDGSFWKDLGTGLKQVLAASDNYVPLASQQDPVAVPTPAPAPPPLPGGNAHPAPPSNVPPSLNVSVSSSSAAPKNPPATFSISKDTGVVTVYGTQRQQKMVQRYLNNYSHQALAQVLIQAKVLEVSLNDQYSTGIDWGQLGANLTHLVSSAQIKMTQPDFTPALTAGNDVFTANLDLGHGFKPVINALSEFGTVRSLSSPRVTVMNNQSAIVNVATNLVYFSIQSTIAPATNNSNPTVSYNSTEKTVPEGVLLNVTPTVDTDTGQIVLAVRPTVSKEVATVTDPTVALNIIANGGSAADVPPDPIPEMSVQEIDSVIKMQSGQTMVMGGLMKDGNQVNQVGVPVLGDVPFLGSLFHSHGDNINKSELIIFLQATIIPGSNVQPMDRRVYKEFGNDTRPFQM